jgi:hypothetical protein
MKCLVLVLTFASLMMLLSAPTYAASEIVLDDVTGLYSGDTVNAGCLVQFTFRLTNTDVNTIFGFTNGFRVWTHRYGAYTNNFSPITGDTLPLGWDTLFDLVFAINRYSADGMGEDTVVFGGSRLMGPGIADGFDQQVWWVRTTPYEEGDGDTLCIDSSFFPPGGTWLWSTTPGGLVCPAWSGPHCFHVQSCPCGVPEFTNCVSSLTFPHCAVAQYTFCAQDIYVCYNLDFDLVSGPGTINKINDTCAIWSYTPSIADVGTSQPITVQVTDLCNCGICTVNMIFTACRNRGNVDNTGGINVGDLVYLVSYLFEDGTAPPCEEDGNIDGDDGINVADLNYLVDYLFFDGPAPPPCT